MYFQNKNKQKNAINRVWCANTIGIYRPPPHQAEDAITNLLDIRLSLNEATASSFTTGIHSFFHHGSNSALNSGGGAAAAGTNNAQQQQQQHHHHHHYHPHLHLHGAGQFLRDNFISGSASSALNAIIGHHGSASTPSSAGINATGSATGNTSNSGSQSAGVVGSITFGTPLNAVTTTQSASSSAVDGAQQSAQLPYSPTPPLQRRLAKSFSVTPALGNNNVSATQQKGARVLCLPTY